MKWSKDNSIVLSKACIWLFAAAEVVCGVTMPLVGDGIVRRRGMPAVSGRLYFVSSLYLLMVPATIALYYLYRLLSNISKEEVFVRQNVVFLRRISWACVLAAVISLVFTVGYQPFLMLAAAAGFMALILRVVKNVFAEAVALKEENDFTI